LISTILKVRWFSVRIVHDRFVDTSPPHTQTTSSALKTPSEKGGLLNWEPTECLHATKTLKPIAQWSLLTEERKEQKQLYIQQVVNILSGVRFVKDVDEWHRRLLGVVRRGARRRPRS